MKTLNAASLAEIAKTHGTDPLNIVEIKWTGSSVWYADKDVFSIPGKIIEMSAIDEVVSYNGKASQTVSFTLDDTDGTIKEILNNNDIHQAAVSIYQCFAGLAFGDKFLIFSGKIASPLNWTEGDRTIQFDVVSEIQARDVGFTHDNIDWPLCFGNVVHVPAAQARMAITGRLEDNLGIVDPLMEWRLSLLVEAYQGQLMIADFYGNVLNGWRSVTYNVESLIRRFVDLLLDIEENRTELNEVNHSIQLLENIIKSELRSETIKDNARLTVAEKRAEYNALTIESNALALEYYTITWQIQYTLELYQHKKNAIAMMANCYTSINQIHEAYMKLQDLKCQQLEYVKDSIVITDLEDFTSDEIMVNGLRWHGSRSGNVFTFTSPGQPLPFYRNVGVKAWTQPLNDCDLPEALNGVANFYVDDTTLQLTNMYCLVTSKTDGYKHVIQVTGQESDKCTFNLIAKSNGTQPTHLIQTPVPFTYDPSITMGGVTIPGGGLVIPGTIYNNINPPLDADVEQRLQGFVPIGQDYLNLLKLCKIRYIDADMGQVVFSVPSVRDIFTIIGYDVEEILEVAAIPLASWFEDEDILIQEMPQEISWLATAGSTVYDASKYNDIYVANILPSTIKAIMAYQTIDGDKTIMPVPSAYYTYNEAEDLGPITVTSIKMKVPLSSIVGEQWDDQIYVTLDSSVGPNVVDILEHLITTYTDKAVDATSFADVKIKQENYPANFALFDRQDIRTLLESIAWQARCAIYEKNGTFYLRYLSEVPTSVKTMTESDIEFGTMKLATTETEDVTTRMDITWRSNYLPEKQPDPLVLRHNIARFGLHKESYNWFIYNHYELVLKSATFWMIRLGNTWKRLVLKTFLTNCDLECHDAITLDFAQRYVATPDIVGEIQRVNYNTSDNAIELELWLPVRFGEMEVYPFAYPADLPATTVFPSVIDVQSGVVENDPVISEVTGEL